MTAEAWVTLAVVLVVLFLLIRDAFSPAVAVFAGTVALLAVGVIDVGEAFQGFSNPAPITVAALYVIAAAVEKTGALAPILSRTIGTRGWVRRPLGRLLGPTVAASAFLNNTPIVAMVAPQVIRWADRRGVSPSKFLMPLSFGAILGGVITVIGTSTNLVVSGQMQAAGYEPIGFFEIGMIGVPVAVVGTAMLVMLTPRLLPDRRSVRAELEEESRRFSVEMVVGAGGPIDGKSIEEAGLRSLTGLFLASAERDGIQIAPIAPDFHLHAGDRLRFVGRADEVVELQAIRGLRSAEEEHLLDLDDPGAGYYEAVVGMESPLVGRTLKEVGFRSRYQAAVLAIHRAGQLVEAKLGTEPLRVGDTLILASDPGFRDRWRNLSDFLLIAEMGAAPPSTGGGARWVAGAMTAMVVLAAAGVVPILQGSLIAALLLIGVRVISADEAKRAVDLEVIGVIAAAFGLAAAVEKSGLAETVASGMVDLFADAGIWGVLLGVVLTTVLMTELITNNAAALLMFPIAVATAEQVGADARGFAIAVAVAASASFLTPIGYQTNTMVYGPGGYRFGDYARLGTPLTIVVVTMVVAGVPLIWG